ncbi:hypothetical protein ABZ920_26615 [Streptomyces sp. NPDC046831]|uniref:hypothetical protein n=1 Tax=Streptomyces sp. NPDC046831 TaxID=3154805 RepID=UPI0033E0454E
MTKRGVLLFLFLVPLAVGLVVLGKAIAVPEKPVCPGIVVGQDGEEHGGPRMRGDTTCHVYNTVTMESSGTRTVRQQLVAQGEQRTQYYLLGGVCTGYGLLGVGVVVSGFGPWRRGAGGEDTEAVRETATR